MGTSDQMATSENVQTEKGLSSNNSDEPSSDESSSESSFPNSSDSVDDSNGGNIVLSHSGYPGSKDSAVKSKEKASTSKDSGTSGIKGKSVLSTTDKEAQKSTSDPSGDASTMQSTASPSMAGWNGSEITYFRMLHPIYGQNFCSISELIRTKSCFEVFKYAQHVADDVTIGKHSARERRLAGKKKKKSMR